MAPQRGKGEHMGNNGPDVPFFDISNLSALELETLGSSALGHAVRRALGRETFPQSVPDEDPIAAHESHV